MSIYRSGNEKQVNSKSTTGLDRIPASPAPGSKVAVPDVAQRDAAFNRKVAEDRARIEKGQAYRGNDLAGGIRSK